MAEQIPEDLKHGRNCAATIPENADECTCGLVWRKKIHDLENRIAKLEAQLAGKWISVDVEMPKEEDRKFWCWVGPSDGILASGGTLIKAAHPFYMKIIRTYRSREGNIKFNCGTLEKVTHYQPLPAPPTNDAKSC
jgi:hypothetical protein